MNEMSLQQLFMYIRTVYRRRNDIYIKDPEGNIIIQDQDYYEYACFIMMRCLLGIPKVPFMQLSDEQITDLLGYKIVDFVMNGENNLQKNHLPHFYALGKKYHGPADKLANVVLIEFALADTYYNRYWTTGDAKDLDMLIACLYRPAKDNLNTSSVNYNGDKRQKFNQHLVNGIAGKISGLSLKKKLLIMLFFAGCRNTMEEMYPYLFKAKEENSKETGGGWNDLIVSLSNGDVTAMEKVAETDLHTVFISMDTLAKRKPAK